MGWMYMHMGICCSNNIDYFRTRYVTFIDKHNNKCIKTSLNTSFTAKYKEIVEYTDHIFTYDKMTVNYSIITYYNVKFKKNIGSWYSKIIINCKPVYTTMIADTQHDTIIITNAVTRTSYLILGGVLSEDEKDPDNYINITSEITELSDNTVCNNNYIIN